jgi:hypothetical protein
MKRRRFSTGSEFLRLDIHRKGTIEMDSTEAASAAAGTDEIARPSHIPVAASSPPDVLIGAGGDPLALGVSVFAIGALTLGMLFVGVFPAGAVGAAVPVAIFASGLPLILTTVWGFIRGQSVLAGIFGTVAGLFTTFGFLVIGLDHNWYAIPAADAPAAQATYFIAFACYFLFLIVPSLQLPRLFTVVIVLVFAGLALAAASQLAAMPVLAQAAGADFLAISFLLFWLFLNVHTTAVGMKPWPPLGRPVAAGADTPNSTIQAEDLT